MFASMGIIVFVSLIVILLIQNRIYTKV
jgi:hypothetical protein